MASKTHFVVGSRKSKLALVQTNEVIDKLKALFPTYTFSIREQETLGDKILDKALSKIGDKGLFTRDLEAGLRDGSIDFAVHSLKDLPTNLPQGLTIGAILKRENPCDVVIVRKDLAGDIKSLEDLEERAKQNQVSPIVGTSSLRRQAQLKRKYPHLTFTDIRGNLDTRLRKLDMGNQPDQLAYSAIILAWAGLERQGTEYTSRITQRLPYDVVHYAVGQGALAVECREDDPVVKDMLARLHDPDTADRCTAERGFLWRLEGGCHVPVGVCTEMVDNSTVRLHGRILSLDGSDLVEGEIQGPREKAWQLGIELAERLLSQGADRILASIKQNSSTSL